jgi:hypothetical protein
MHTQNSWGGRYRDRGHNFTFNNLYYRLRGWEIYKLVNNVSTLFRFNAIVVFLFFYAAFFLPKRHREWESLFFIAAVLGFTLLTGRHNPQYYILAFPFISVLAARAFWQILRPRPIMAALLIFLIVLGPLERYLRFFAWEGELDTYYKLNTYSLNRIKRVLSLTSVDDYVYDGNIIFNLFRKDVDFVWWGVGEPYKMIETLEELADYKYDIYDRIATYRPKVISAFGIPDMKHPVIAENYIQDDVFPELFVRLSVGSGRAPQTTERDNPAQP